MDEIEFCEDEFFDSRAYAELAKREKNEKRRRVLEEFSRQEYQHYLFWKRIAKNCSPKISKIKLYMLIFGRRLFGLTFTMKLLERGEENTINAYKQYLVKLPSEYRSELQKIIIEEEDHERTFYKQLDERIVKYMSFIVLGLADAIIEITGVHAGFLGVTNSTIMAGIAGLVVGLSAAISMASAAYLQAKHEIHRKPSTSALATGLAYIMAVAVLALPYFLIRIMMTAFTVSVSLALILIAGFTFYGSVVFDKKFSKEFLESMGLMLGTALASFLFGEMLGKTFGIQKIFT